MRQAQNRPSIGEVISRKIHEIMRRFFATVIISVNSDSKVCTLKMTHLRQDGTVLRNETHEFKTAFSDIPIEAAKFIQRARRHNPYLYVVSYAQSMRQGAIDAVGAADYEKFGVQASGVKKIVMQSSWSVYIAPEGIKEARRKFATSQGLDLLFSPFVLLYVGTRERRERNTKKLYALQCRSSVTLAVLDRDNFFFGGFFSLESDVEFQGDRKSKEESIAGLQGLDFEDSQGVDVDAILNQNLEEVNSLGDFSEDFGMDDFEEHPLPGGGRDQDERGSLDDFARAISVAKIVKNSLSEFYRNSVYRGDFIEEVVFLDTYGISSASIAHYRSALLLELKVVKFDMMSTLSELAKEEIFTKDSGK